MKHLAALLVLALAGCTSCAEKLVPAGLPGVPLELDPTLAISSANGNGGHACPVNGYVITAAHVVWDEERKTYVRVAWSDGAGSEGLGEVAAIHPALDLVVLQTEGGAIKFLPAGQIAVGERVYWFEYDFRTRKNALRARRRFATVLRVVAQHYILDDMPIAGASGSCLLNEQGQVVGLVVAGFDTDDKLGVGAAVKLPEELKASHE